MTNIISKVKGFFEKVGQLTNKELMLLSVGMLIGFASAILDFAFYMSIYGTL